MEALLSYFAEGATTATLALPRQLATLGTSRDDLLALRDPSLHPRHVSLHWQPARATWELTRLHPDGRVEVNGRSVGESESLPLNHLDEVRVGQTLFRFHKLPAEPRCSGQPCSELALDKKTVLIGRSSPASGTTESPDSVRIDLDGEDSGISRLHAQIVCDAGTWYIEDRSKTGTELNGRAFTRKPLVFGDRFRIRDYFFEFTGTGIIRVDQASGGRIEAREVTISVPAGEGKRTILSNVSAEIRSGEFVGILGGSGTGKSTLLRALCGLMPVTSGSILIDGAPLQTAVGNSGMGFVPQDDIVHYELTVRQALLYSARLRLKAPAQVIDALVEGTIQRLGLVTQSRQRIASLSGGQRKRVNIATELLTRPPVLLLDEPSSGLDPANEEELMTMLQNLRLTGQTVVCSTHVLHKAYLFDRICFVHSGQLMFMGTPTEARHFFLDEDETGSASAGHAPLEKIYALFSHSQEQTLLWRGKFASSKMAPGNNPASPPPIRLVANRSMAKNRPGMISRLIVLLQRQWAILRSDKLNIVFLFAQAAIIGLLAGWVGRSEPEFRMFLTMIAALWFGCNNAAQQLTREIPVFRRERVSGLGIHTYLQSKWTFLSAITVMQCAVMLCCMIAVLGLSSALGLIPLTEWAEVKPAGYLLHAAAFILTSFTGVGIGLAISATARSSTQAAIWVPLILIPQILFAGFVVPLADMPVSVRMFSHLIPSASSQRLLDLGNIIDKPMPVMTHNTKIPLFWESKQKEDGTWAPRSFSMPVKDGVPRDDIAEMNNLNRAWQNLAVDHSKIGTFAPPSPSGESVYVSDRPDVPGKVAGDIFKDMKPAWIAMSFLFGWLIAAYAIIWTGLLRRDPLRRRSQLAG
ncbi:MAG TPA: ATP-binding cassette domain-containing protein [Verrucomicrobiales bacterium]|nr:ATP-binding cassette domain-containing protein [Verrucomicrobiales bacterium]